MPAQDKKIIYAVFAGSVIGLAFLGGESGIDIHNGYKYIMNNSKYQVI